MLTMLMLRTLWPLAAERSPALIEGMVSTAPQVLAAQGLTSPLSIAHAMAQFSHETQGGTELEENLNYSAAGLMATWPSRFDAVRAAALAHQPEAIARAVYDGRLGNQPGSDDGWLYRGRGGAQTSGRVNYQRLGARLGLPLLNQPEAVNEPAHFLACATGQFILCGCLPFAERDDLNGVTYHLNGGFIGLTQRAIWLARWKDALAPAVTAAPGTLWLQERLNLWGEEPPLLLDGCFGPMTAAALRRFQERRHLLPDGRLSDQTVTALAAQPAS
ncbi:peptidoglycan-binding protein [Acidisoma sp. C75]